MLSKNAIKYIHSLTIKKYRGIHGKFIAEGPKLVSELAESNLLIYELYASEDWLKLNSSIISKVSSVKSISVEELSKISSLSTPNQVLAVVDIPEREFEINIVNDSMVIILDDIRDPGNLGTIIRIADWFGLRHIVCSSNSVDTYNSKTVQASMGSIGRVNVYYSNLAEIMLKVPAVVPVYGAYLEGNPIYKETFAKNGLLVIGNEANGISNEIAKFITKKISIPAGDQSEVHAESLNASIATAIICSEMNRQKAFL
jgi:TrmH family RNA methyltransferase